MSIHTAPRTNVVSNRQSALNNGAFSIPQLLQECLGRTRIESVTGKWLASDFNVNCLGHAGLDSLTPQAEPERIGNEAVSNNEVRLSLLSCAVPSVKRQPP